MPEVGTIALPWIALVKNSKSIYLYSVSGSKLIFLIKDFLTHLLGAPVFGFAVHAFLL